jgi:Flp pilus assembly protein TadG
MLADLTYRFLSRQTPKRSRRLKRVTGGTLVEFALVFIILVTILFGIAEFGHMLYAYHFVNQAAKEATRFAMVNGSTCNNDSTFSTNGLGSCTAPVTCTAGSCSTCTSGCTFAGINDIQNFVQMITPMGIDHTKVTVTPTWPGTSDYCATTVPNHNGPSCPVDVQVSYNYNFLFPLIKLKTGGSAVTLSSKSEMVIAH